jgi:hypothetical protein
MSSLLLLLLYDVRQKTIASISSFQKGIRAWLRGGLPRHLLESAVAGRSVYVGGLGNGVSA